MTQLHASAERIRAQILAILGAWGMAEDLAATTAEAMVETDLMGVDSHGISMLMMYEGQRRAGQLDLHARPRVLRDLPSLALMDGGANLGHPVAAAAMMLATDKALAAGIGAVGVVNSHHFGAAGHYARLAAARGVVALIASSARTVLMVPTRGAMPMLGSNPLAFAAPMPGAPPVVLDIATTTVAANKVKVYELNGKPIPEGWVVDGAGHAITDSTAAMAQIFRERHHAARRGGAHGRAQGLRPWADGADPVGDAHRRVLLAAAQPHAARGRPRQYRPLLPGDRPARAAPRWRL
jgi:LDH2 family malate/lactate/ureidoglycolate dehydrogenase